MAKPIRILIVDDSDDDAELIIRTLYRAGFSAQWRRVNTAEMLGAAVAAAEWDVITCDYVMSGFDGMEAVIIARTAAPHTPVIAVTGDIGEARSALMIKLGAFAFVSKRTLSTLPHTIEAALAEY